MSDEPERIWVHALTELHRMARPLNEWNEPKYAVEYVHADRIRQLEAERDAAYRRGLEDAAKVAESMPDALVGTMELTPSQYDIAAAIRALALKEQSNE